MAYYRLTWLCSVLKVGVVEVMMVVVVAVGCLQNSRASSKRNCVSLRLRGEVTSFGGCVSLQLRLARVLVLLKTVLFYYLYLLRERSGNVFTYR
jgi:hypothetical protein